MEEFKNFNEYIRRIEEHGAHKAGLAKIIPPREWQARKMGYQDVNVSIAAPITQLCVYESKLCGTFHVITSPAKGSHDWITSVYFGAHPVTVYTDQFTFTIHHSPLSAEQRTLDMLVLATVWRLYGCCKKWTHSWHQSYCSSMCDCWLLIPWPTGSTVLPLTAWPWTFCAPTRDRYTCYCKLKIMYYCSCMTLRFCFILNSIIIDCITILFSIIRTVALRTSTHLCIECRRRQLQDSASEFHPSSVNYTESQGQVAVWQACS